MKFIRVVHKKGKHLSDLNSMLYSIRKMLFASKCKVTIAIGARSLTPEHIPDWQKATGWTSIPKTDETLVAWRNYNKYPECAVYNRKKGFKTWYLTDRTVSEDIWMEKSYTITRKRGQYLPACPWVEGVEYGSTLPVDVEYHMNITVLQRVWSLKPLVDWLYGQLFLPIWERVLPLHNIGQRPQHP